MMSNIHTSSLCLTQLTLFFSVMKVVSFRGVHLALAATCQKPMHNL
jgi:hypothetical protein